MFGPDTCRFHDLEALLDAPQESLDLIDCNGHLALNVCSVGFDARIGLGAADFKKLPLVSGTMAYQLSALRTILQGIHRALPGGAGRRGAAAQEVYPPVRLQRPLLRRRLQPVPTALPDDGALDFVIIKGVSRLTILALIGTYAKAAQKRSRRSSCAGAGN